MNKKQIVIMAGVGLICFGLSFTVGLFTRTSEQPTSTDGVPGGAQEVEALAGNDDAVGATGTVGMVPSNSFQAKQVKLGRALSEKQLNSLVYEMRSKLLEFTSKEKALIEKEGRIQMSIEELQKNIKFMEDLRVKLAATVSSIKQQQKVLDGRLVRIEEVEKKNLMKIATMYDAMKPQQSSEMMINMATKLNQLDVAVKMVYYMTERTSAKMLAEITKKNPDLAATISEKLRWIEEVKQ